MRGTLLAVAFCALVTTPVLAQDSGLGGVIHNLDKTLNPSDNSTRSDAYRQDSTGTRRSSSHMHFNNDDDMRREQQRLSDARRQLDDANQRYRDEQADFDDASRDYRSRR